MMRIVINQLQLELVCEKESGREARTEEKKTQDREINTTARRNKRAQQDQTTRTTLVLVLQQQVEDRIVGIVTLPTSS